MKNCISYVAIVISFAATLFPTVTCVAHPADIPKTMQAPEPESHDAKIVQVSEAKNHENIGSPLAWAASIVASMFGGGAAVGLISLFYNARLDRRRRRADYVDRQLRELYGPLQLFTSSSQEIYKRTREIHQAANMEYGAENSSKHSRQAASDGLRASTDVNNEYYAMADNNTQRMAEILTKNYALIEPDDAETFAEFHIHSIRRKTEFDELHQPKLAYEVYTHVALICNLPPEFVELVNRRFKEKKAELERLSL